MTLVALAITVTIILSLILTYKSLIDALKDRVETNVTQLTVLQPILGGDPNLKLNLLNNLNLYSKTKFVMLVDSDDKTGQIDTEQALKNSENKNSEIIYCPPPQKDCNPKIFNLNIGVDHCHDICVALDDDCRLVQGSLERLAGGLKQHQLVSGIPFYCNTGNIWSRMIAQFPNSYSLTTYFSPLFFGPCRTINGMYFAAKRRDILNSGGFESVQERMCDDFELAKAFCKQGYTIGQMAAPVIIHAYLPNIKNYWNLLRRWMYFSRQQIQEFISPTVILMVFIPPLLPSIAVVAAVSGFTSESMIIGLTWFIRKTVITLWQKSLLNVSFKTSIGLSLISDLVMPIAFMSSFSRKPLVWRNKYFQCNNRKVQWSP